LDTETIRKIKYNGAKESRRHKDLKYQLSRWLENTPGIKGPVQIEETFFHQDGGREWRRPDISCTWNDIKIVFEIQISSDFLDVIISREEFYRNQGVFIVWVFDQLQLDRFTTKDIYIGNQKNIFLFNEASLQTSNQGNRLFFECHHKKPILEGNHIVDSWEQLFAGLQEITFDHQRMQAFYFDYDAARRDLVNLLLRKEFEGYWRIKRATMNPTLVHNQDEIFKQRLMEHLGLSESVLTSTITKVLDCLYSIKTSKICNYNGNLFHLIDVMMNYRKPFIFVITWALEIYGHRKLFESRPAFLRKVEEYHHGVNIRDPEYARDRTFDPLFKLLFPELSDKL
jgi:hypothetical protein